MRRLALALLLALSTQAAAADLERGSLDAPWVEDFDARHRRATVGEVAAIMGAPALAFGVFMASPKLTWSPQPRIGVPLAIAGGAAAVAGPTLLASGVGGANRLLREQGMTVDRTAANLSWTLLAAAGTFEALAVTRDGPFPWELHGAAAACWTGSVAAGIVQQHVNHRALRVRRLAAFDPVVGPWIERDVRGVAVALAF